MSLVMGTGVDSATTGAGALLEQGEFGVVVQQLLLSGRLRGDPSLGPSVEHQARAVKAIFEAAGVRHRGAQRAASDFFRTTPGCPDVRNPGPLFCSCDRTM